MSRELGTLRSCPPSISKERRFALKKIQKVDLAYLTRTTLPPAAAVRVEQVKSGLPARAVQEAVKLHLRRNAFSREACRLQRLV